MSLTWLPMIAGAVLIVAGIGQIYLQMRERRGDIPTLSQSVEFSKDKVGAQSAYVGTTMIVVGAVLLLGAYFFAK